MAFDLDKLDEIIKTLKGIRIKEALALKQRLQKERQKLVSARIIEQKETKIKISANQNRSSKLSRYWRYVKLIHANYPNLKITEIRKQLKERQEGNDVSIPDAIWQNPSL